ncbi:MAG: phosphopantetheine-binding protein [Pseudomonadota bacterium]
MELRNTETELNEISDRRSHPRIAKALSINFTVFDGDHTSGIFFPKYDAQTHDIGTGGVSCNAIIADKTVVEELSAKKKKLKLNIQLVGKNNNISPKADVAWIYNLKGLSVKTKYGMGLRFVNMSKAENDLLSSYVGEMIVLKQEQRAQNRQKIKKVLAQVGRISEESFSDSARIREDLGVDSLMAVETLAVLETIYDIEIDVSRVIEVITVGDMMDLVEDYSEQRV